MNRHATCVNTIIRGILLSIPVTAAGGTNVASQPARTVTFMGIRDSSRSTVFVIDATETTSTRLNAIRSDLTEAVSELSAAQSFNTVFPHLAGFTTLSVSLLPATDENRIKLRTLLSRVRTDIATDPLPAIEAAFAMHPDVIFFVADGDFPDNDLVQRRFHELEQGSRVRVNTIALMTHGGDVEFARVLKRVAAESGGAFREVMAESESGH